MYCLISLHDLKTVMYIGTHDGCCSTKWLYYMFGIPTYIEVYKGE